MRPQQAQRRLSAFSALSLIAATSAASPTSYVDPLFATRGGAGFGGWGCQARNPGAMAPFPFLRLGPDTTRVDDVLGEAWSKLNRHAGYFGSDTHIRAFSHTRVQGAGDADLGTVGVMPVRGGAAAIAALAAQKPVTLPFPPLTLDRSPFRQAVVLGRPAEEARPGYYSVQLGAINVLAELAASGTHAGAHRYTCASGVAPGGGGPPASGPCALVVDVCHRAHDQQCGATTTVSLAQGASASSWLVSGMHEDRGEFVRFNYSGVNIFFTMQITASSGAPLAPVELGLWKGYAVVSNATGSATVGADLDSLGAFLVFPPPAADGAASAVTIEVRVGLSTVSAAAASANLLAEQGNGRGDGGLVAFDEVAAASDAAWAKLLGAVSVTPAADSSAAGASDTDALAAGLHEARGGDAGLGAVAAAEAEIDMAAEAALAAYLATPSGAALAVSHGWSDLPASWAPAIAAWRAAGRPGARDDATLALALALKEPPRVNLARALGALKVGAAVSRAAAAAARAADPLGADLAVFYTMVYLSFSAPSTYSDSDGRYLGFDAEVHAADIPGASFVSDLSLWDTHRSQAVWHALAAPRALADTAASLLDMTRQGDMGMPRWPFANLYTEDMEGRHGVVMLADCVLTSGACDGRVAPADAAAAVIEAILDQDQSDPEYPVPGGYCSWPLCSASRTLEWAYDDFAASRFAAAAGNASLAAQLLARAQNWRNVFDAKIPTLAPRRANGSFVEDSSIWQPHPDNAYFTEGNAAQWMWSVPHNLSALAAAFPGGPGPVGGRGDSFAAQLQVVLANQTYWPLSTFLPNPYTWLGNEPSMLLPFSHAFSGAADSWRAAFWGRWHLRTYFTPTADCIPGNDDYGTLSTWAVWAYLGLYPVAGTGAFVLGSPVFADAVVAVPAGYGPFSGAASPSLHIVAHNASASNIYVAGARANGVALAQPLVTWSQLFASPGAEALLEFFMAPQPTQWGGRKV